jgi:hypothetical protein
VVPGAGGSTRWDRRRPCRRRSLGCPSPERTPASGTGRPRRPSSGTWQVVGNGEHRTGVLSAVTGEGIEGNCPRTSIFIDDDAMITAQCGQSGSRRFLAGPAARVVRLA